MESIPWRSRRPRQIRAPMRLHRKTDPLAKWRNTTPSAWTDALASGETANRTSFVKSAIPREPALAFLLNNENFVGILYLSTGLCVSLPPLDNLSVSESLALARHTSYD